MKTLKVRDARREDIGGILEIYRTSLLGLEEEGAEWYGGILEASPSAVVFLVAEGAGRTLGFALAYVSGSYGYLDALAVHPEYRGLGVGRSLLEALESRLAERGVGELGLSVKSNNADALGFYLKQGYVIRGSVLLLTATVGALQLASNSKLEAKIIGAETARKLRGRIRAMPTAWWSTLTEDADAQIYRRFGRERFLVVYENGRFRGLLEFEPEREVLVDYLAVSYDRPARSLAALLGGIGRLMERWGISDITIPVDSSKHALTATLLKRGFRITGVEFRLAKKLRTPERQRGIRS